MTSTDSRYPYTYAADLIRTWAGYDERGAKLSRSDASHIRSQIARIIGMDDAELARRLADHFRANEQSINEAALAALMQARSVAQ